MTYIRCMSHLLYLPGSVLRTPWSARCHGKTILNSSCITTSGRIRQTLITILLVVSCYMLTLWLFMTIPGHMILTFNEWNKLCQAAAIHGQAQQKEEFRSRQLPYMPLHVVPSNGSDCSAGSPTAHSAEDIVMAGLTLGGTCLILVLLFLCASLRPRCGADRAGIKSECFATELWPI